MILGRPTNAWTGLITSALALLQVLLVTLVENIDATVVATILGSVGVFLGVFIAFVAGQPPTVSSGSTVNVSTPQGEPNPSATLTVTPQGVVSAHTHETHHAEGTPTA